MNIPIKKGVVVYPCDLLTEVVFCRVHPGEILDFKLDKKLGILSARCQYCKKTYFVKLKRQEKVKIITSE